MALQQHLVERGVSAADINGIAGKIRRLYRWGAARKLVPQAAYELLRTVEPVRAGYGGVPLKKRVRSVAHEIVEATLPHLSRVVAAMARLQRHSGMRPSEVCTLRSDDVDTSSEVWVYRPGSHKTEHHEQERQIHIGPQAKEILRPFLLRDRGAYCFDPREAEEERLADRHRRRKTPLSCGNRPRTNRRESPRVQPGDHYTTATYRRAIERGCERAGVERWTPNRLRHLRATELKHLYGHDGARSVLGHSSINTTQIYVDQDVEIARRIARETG